MVQLYAIKIPKPTQMKLLLPFLIMLSLTSCYRKTYIQTVKVSYTSTGMKITPVDEAQQVNSDNCPAGEEFKILIRR